MPDDIYVKHYFGESADRPEVENGTILYETDTRALFVDQNNQRTRYNPPANWNEMNTDDPSYIENKPELGTAAAKDVAETLEDENAVPTLDMIETALYWYEPIIGYTWERVVDIVNDGTYKDKFAIGDTFDLVVGDLGNLQAQIVAFDHYDRNDGNGKCHIVFMTRKPLPSMNTNNVKNFSNFKNTTIYNYLNNNFKQELPQILQNNILNVIVKSSRYGGINTYNCDIMLPSYHEFTSNWAQINDSVNNNIPYFAEYRIMENAIRYAENGDRFKILCRDCSYSNSTDDSECFIQFYEGWNDWQARMINPISIVNDNTYRVFPIFCI